MTFITRAGLAVAIGIVLVTLNSCMIPFQYTYTLTPFEIGNTFGNYAETSVSFPAEVTDPKIYFSEVKVKYTVRRAGNFTANVALYVSTDTLVDNAKSEFDEQLFNVNLASTQTAISGTIVSENARIALNNKQATLVIGIENFSATLFDPVFVDVTIDFSGTYSLF